VVGLKPRNFLTQQLPFHGRFAQLFAQAANLTVTAIERLFFQRFLASIEERRAPGRETGSREPELTGQQVKCFSPQQTSHDLGFLPCGKPLGFLPSMLAPLSSRSASFLRGDLYGNLLGIHLDTSCELLYPMWCPIKLYTKPIMV
jgi:hypothetical protein